MTITVEIPEKLVPLLEERARTEGKEPEDFVVEIIEKELGAGAAPKPLTERERVRAILKEAGFLSEVSPELVKRYVKPRSKEEREAMLKHLQQISFSPTFSEMIIEDRGPR